MFGKTLVHEFLISYSHAEWYLHFSDSATTSAHCGILLEYCSAVWCSAADTHLKLLDCIVSGACFLAGGVLNCNLSHRRSVAVLCMLYKIRCNPMHPLCALYLCLMCQSGLHPVLWSHIGILMCLPAVEPRSTAGLLFPSQYLSGTICLTPYSMVWDWRVSRAGPMPFLLARLLSPFLSSTIFPFSSFPL